VRIKWLKWWKFEVRLGSVGCCENKMAKMGVKWWKFEVRLGSVGVVRIKWLKWEQMDEFGIKW
jgi:hypothetical protein